MSLSHLVRFEVCGQISIVYSVGTCQVVLREKARPLNRSANTF